ncbi:hypothetical protein C3L33_11508, partial [Rhododendron williamsianum]
DEPLKTTFKNMHQGYPKETLMRFLKAREGDFPKPIKWKFAMRHNYNTWLCMQKPIVPTEFYRAVRDSQLIGMSGYSKEVLVCYTSSTLVADRSPGLAIGAGLSTFDKASINYYVQSHIQMNEYRDRVLFVSIPSAMKKFGRHISTCVKVLDMTGLKLSSLNQIKLLSVISTIDDLNYPEKTTAYYIVNAPYVFSACWKVVRPLLQERTRNKVQVLPGSGKDELLKIMDYASLPHFCKREGSGSSFHSRNKTTDNCFSLDHAFHQQLYNYIKQQAELMKAPIRQSSVHVDFPEPDPEDGNIAETIESACKTMGTRIGLSNSLRGSR